MSVRRITGLVSAVVSAGLLASLARPAAAQRPDSTTRPAPLTAPAAAAAQDSLQPPISPRRAMLYSLLIPGSAQSILGRHKAASAFLLVEAISVSMIRESAADLREARRIADDTVVTSWVDPSGAPLTTPAIRPAAFSEAYVHTRQAHVEDWAALLVANHLFAAADAFVAANLWDVPARLGLRLTPGQGTISASIRW